MGKPTHRVKELGALNWNPLWCWTVSRGNLLLSLMLSLTAAVTGEDYSALSGGRAPPALYTYRHRAPDNKEEAALAHKGNEDRALFNASDPEHNQLL